MKIVKFTLFGVMSGAFENDLNSCQYIASENPPKDWTACVPRTFVGIHGMGPVWVGSSISEGSFGKTFQLSHTDPELVLKVIKDVEENACMETMVLRALGGMGGFVPRIFEITKGFPPLCLPRAIVMEKMGDANWSEVYTGFDPVFFKRFQQLLKAVAKLHESGFIHTDLLGQNIRVRANDPNFVALIDFGDAKLDDGSDPEYGRRSDWVDVATLAWSAAAWPQPAWALELLSDAMMLKPNESLNLDKWIPYIEFLGVAR